VIKLASYAGTAGPVLFFAVVLAEGFLRPDYHPLRQTISELSLGPRGWIQTANFIVFGVLFLVFAAGMRAAVTRGPAARWGGRLLLLIGLGVLGCGLFPAEGWPPSSMSTAGLLHLVCAMVLIFALLPVATGLMCRGFATDPRWRSLAALTGAASFVTLVLLVAGLSLMSPPGEPAGIGNDYAGLIQRVDVGVFLAWQIAAARRLATAEIRSN
jgi:hypothetical membrane protein